MTMNPGPVSGPERWDVRPGRGARTARAWGDALTETHGAFEVRLPDDDAFTGSVVRHRLGTMDVVECRSTPFAASAPRTRRTNRASSASVSRCCCGESSGSRGRMPGTTC